MALRKNTMVEVYSGASSLANGGQEGEQGTVTKRKGQRTRHKSLRPLLCDIPRHIQKYDLPISPADSKINQIDKLIHYCTYNFPLLVNKHIILKHTYYINKNNNKFILPLNIIQVSYIQLEIH